MIILQEINSENQNIPFHIYQSSLHYHTDFFDNPLWFFRHPKFGIYFSFDFLFNPVKLFYIGKPLWIILNYCFRKGIPLFLNRYTQFYSINMESNLRENSIQSHNWKSQFLGLLKGTGNLTPTRLLFTNLHTNVTRWNT